MTFSKPTLLSLFGLAISLHSVTCAATRILIVGDSNAEGIGQSLESLCLGSTVHNIGMGGTTAEQWADYTSDIVSGCGDAWDVVYISVGGNDLLGSGCTMSASDLADKIELAVKNIVTNIAPGASNYLLTGYCMPYRSEEGDEGCVEPSDFTALGDAMSAIDNKNNIFESDSSSVTVIDSLSACGGSSSAFSDELYFLDAIHLNSKGYCKIFTQPDVQMALSCGEISIDCDSPGFDIYGLDQNCDVGTHEENNHEESTDEPSSDNEPNSDK